MFKPYKYEKVNASSYSSALPNRSFSVCNKSINLKFRSVVALIFMLTGMAIFLTKVLVPVVVIYANTENKKPVVSPVPAGGGTSLSLSSNISNNIDRPNDFVFDELNPNFDPSAHLEPKTRHKDDLPKYFYLTIPKLGIEDAKVEVNAATLDPRNALGHYAGSCLPDEDCNVFIYGHSKYTRSDEADYKYHEGDYSYIFKDLDQLEYGDEFCISFDGKPYCYIVEMTKVESPKDVNPLEEPMQKSLGNHENTVQLFTCTPAGTTKYRLSVVGRLVKQ